MAGYFWTILGEGPSGGGAVGVLRGLLNRTAPPLPTGYTSVEQVSTRATENADVVRQVVTLDGVDFIFEFQFNERSSAWFLSLFDSDELPIIESKKIVVEQNLLLGVVDDRAPTGTLVCYENSGALIEATRYSFASKTHGLYYVV